MTLRRLAVPLLIAALLLGGWYAGRGLGLAAVVSGLVLWALLHLTRLMQVMHRAARQPLGHVDSAVMLNARLKAGWGLAQVVALTRSLGEGLTPAGQEPEIYRWCDAGGAQVTCEFRGGRLERWQLERPSPAHAP